ncbi:MAG: outer membrane protein transport protein [Acidobacteria bacterium]|nr:outer membrane protein transport protein [Acidobacteriota bacterium]
MAGRKILLAAGLSAALPALAGAAGFGIFEAGAKATGMSGAFTATADDPSAMFYNPAGLAFQSGSRLMTGGTLIAPSSDFKGANPFPGSSVSESQEKNLFFPPGMYYARSLTDKLTFGIGAFTDFGLATEWSDPKTYSGRYLSTKAELKSISFQPTVAYKLSDQFGVGVGIEMRRSMVKLARHQPFLNPFNNQVLDVATIDMESDWKMGVGFSVGVLAKPKENWSVGFSYRHSIKIDYEGTGTFTLNPTGSPALDALLKTKLPLGEHPISTSIEYPNMASFGLATTAIDKWTIELDVNWTGWSTFDVLELKFEDLNLVQEIPEEYEDVFNYRIGVERRMSEKMALRGGYIFDPSPQPVQGVGPLLPDSDRHGINIGIGYTMGKWTLDVANLFLFFEERSTVVDGDPKNRDGYDGTYSTFADLLSFSLSRKF